MHPKPIFITDDEVKGVLKFELLIPAMEQALVDFSAGRIQQPVRTVLNVREHEGWFALMPAVSGELMGAKLVTFYPRNASLGLPTHLAVIQLFNSSTGVPLAWLEARIITELRTAAVSAVATNRLAPRQAQVLAILGSGVQAHSHLEALGHVRQFDDVRVWSRTREHAERFASQHNVRAAPTVEAAVKDADVVVTATSSDEPVLQGRWLKDTAYVNAVGAVGPKRRELDDDVMRGALVVESREAAVRESGDVILSRATVFAEIGELLSDESRMLDAKQVVFKSLGIASEDLVAAQLVYAAIRRSRETNVPGTGSSISRC